MKLLKAVVTVGSQRFNKDQVIIDYPHITKQQILKPAEAKFIKLDQNKQSKNCTSRVHEVPSCLTQIVTLLNPKTPEKLEALMLSSRELEPIMYFFIGKQTKILDFVKGGNHDSSQQITLLIFLSVKNIS
jgi:hypothetical protein